MSLPLEKMLNDNKEGKDNEEAVLIQETSCSLDQDAGGEESETQVNSRYISIVQPAGWLRGQ